MVGSPALAKINNLLNWYMPWKPGTFSIRRNEEVESLSPLTRPYHGRKSSIIWERLSLMEGLIHHQMFLCNQCPSPMPREFLQTFLMESQVNDQEPTPIH